MNRLFCDICKKEIEPDAMSIGNMRRVKTIYTLEGKPSMAQDNLDICETCNDKIWEFTSKLKAKEPNAPTDKK